VLFAVVNGMLDAVAVDDIARLESELIEYASVHHPETMQGLRSARELSPLLEQELATLVEAFVRDRFGRSAPDDDGMAAAASVPEDPEAAPIDASREGPGGIEV